MTTNTHNALTTYHCRDEDYDADIEAASPLEAAKEFVDLYCVHDDEDHRTSWFRVWVDDEPHKIALDPSEPDCLGDDHVWASPLAVVGGIADNPGVYGHGGGVTHSSACLLCGCRRTRDTWAQDPSDGQQGLESVEYEPACYVDELDRAGRYWMLPVIAEEGARPDIDDACHIAWGTRAEAVRYLRAWDAAAGNDEYFSNPEPCEDSYLIEQCEDERAPYVRVSDLLDIADTW